MRVRIPTGLVLAAAVAAAPARGQVAAPTLVEDELHEEPPAQPGRKPGRAVRAGEPIPEPPPVAAEPLAPRVPAPPASPSAAPGAATRAGALPGVSIGSEELARLQRPIDPVKARWAQLVEWWRERRLALRDHDLSRADAARIRILEAKRELAIENLTAFAVAEVRESERALAARSPDDAVLHAALAVDLAPDLAESHLALARARFDRDPAAPLPVMAAVGAALGAAMREPHTIRAFYGDVAGAAMAALFLAAVASMVLLVLRRLRLFLHDFGHLPLVRAGTPAQTALLALALLGLPVGLRLGSFVALFVAVLAVWLYLSWPERAVATVSLLSVGLLPYLAWGAARITAWTGTLAEQVFEIERGGDSGIIADQLEARAAAEKLPAPALLALGRHYKRRGDLERALPWYRGAAAEDARSPEVQVDLGNLHFLRGDLDAAKAAYLAALDLGGSASVLAAAHYNLSKLYLRLAAVEQSTEARKKAQQQDAAFLARYGSDDDFRANRWLIDAQVPQDQIAALARGDPGPRAVAAAVLARVAGAVPRDAWPALPLGLVAALWGLALAARLRLSRPCEKCGRPACRRCDGVTGALCGQCVNVFHRQGVVDARDRARKEAQVRRHVRWRQVAVRLLAVVGGGAGHIFGGDPVRGFFFLVGIAFLGFVVWFWRGVLPAPQPSPYAAAAKLGLAAPVGLALYLLAVRDAFRRIGEE